MNSFTIALTNVLLMIFYMVPGFLLRKSNKITEDELGGVSAILLYGCTPFLVISTFLRMEFSWSFLGQMGIFFLVTLATQTIFMCLLYHFFFKKHYDDPKYPVMTMASTIGNVGYFGLPIVSALFPNTPEIPCYTAMYMMSMNCITYSLGLYFLTGDKKFASVPAIFKNPASLGLYIGLPIYIFGLAKYIPDSFRSGITLIGNMSAPLCMIVLGIRLGSRPLKEIFRSWQVYPVIALKMIAYPLFAYGVVYFLPLPTAFKATVLILSAAPCGTVVQTLPERYRKGDADFAARALFVSTTLCFLTIPLLALLL